MSAFATISSSLRVRIALLRDAVRVRLAAMIQVVRVRMTAAGRRAAAISSSARRTVGLSTARILAAVAPVVAALRDIGCRAYARVRALVPALRQGFAVAAGVPLAFIGTQAVLGAAQAIGLGVIKLAMVAILADFLLGFLPWQSRPGLRRNLQGAVAAALLGIALAGATIAHAIDPGPAATDVEPASATSPESPVAAAHDVAVAPEPEDLIPACPTDRRTRRRMAGSNSKA